MARERCRVCRNALAACICQWVSPIFNQTKIVILQHTDEAKKPLGTAKIVSLCLRNVLVKVGIDFSDDAEIMSLIEAPDDRLGLLYPSDSSIDLADWGRGVAPQTHQDETPSPVHSKTLIVLDGTWRNTRELMLANKALQHIPSVKLTPSHQSDYRIRKAPFAQSLSTVEAVSQVLTALEPETNIEAMLSCFKNMIDYQISRMGEDVYRRNYLSQTNEGY